MRIVLDVNVWISALLWGGLPSTILRLARNKEVTIFVSEALLLELETTLKRSKFQSRLQQRGQTVEFLISLTQELSESCGTIADIDVPELRDPKDSKILATALRVEADVLVTGDLDLLVMKEFRGIPILTIANFLESYFPVQ
jgi:uncharacterized protein